MIRYLDLSEDIGGGTHFAFYDTVSNVILTFGGHLGEGVQVFVSRAHFEEVYKGSYNIRPLERYTNLIPVHEEEE